MAFLFCDGFDQYTNNADLAEKGWLIIPSLFGASSDYVINTTGSQWGTGCLEIDDDNTISSINGLWHGIPTFIDGSVDESVYAAFWVHFETLAAAELFFQFMCSGTATNATAALEIQTDGSIDIKKQSGTVIGSTAGGLISAGNWYWICFRCMPKNTTGEVQLWVDGTERVTTTVSDMVGSGQNADIGSFILSGGNGTSNTISFDDIIIWDDSGADNFTADISPSRIYTLRPDGTGSATNSTAVGAANQWDACSDTGGTDFTTYCRYSSTGQDLFACEDLAVIPSTIRSVVINHVQQALGTVTYTGRSLVREGATTGTGTTKNVTHGWSTADAKTIQTTFDTNPDTAGAWVFDEINGMEIGFERVS